jgi:hypothetical protein
VASGRDASRAGGGRLKFALELRRRKLERVAGDDALGDLDLFEDRRDRDAAVLRCEAAEAAFRLLQLPLAADLVPAAGLVPGDRDMDEALVEVAFVRRGRAPGVLELLVGGEELAAANQVQASSKLVRGRS